MKIAINLLPAEFTQEEVKRAKFVKLQTIGVVIILLMIFLASLTIALRILQGQNLQQVQAKAAQAEEKVGALRETQGSILLLKNRLNAISEYLGQPSKQNEIYKFIDSIIPPSIGITSISIDKSGDVSLVALASDSTSLDNFLVGLTSEELNQGKIKQVSIETLTRGRDGVYRVNLQIQLN